MTEKKKHYIRALIVIFEVLVAVCVVFGTNRILKTKNDALIKKANNVEIVQQQDYFSNSNLLGVRDVDAVFANKVTTYFDKQNFKGSITAYRNKKLILQRGYGVLNKSANLYYDYTTMFPMYTTQRELNTVLLLDLAASKKVSIQESKRYISTIKRQFSIKSLLLNQIKFASANKKLDNFKDLNKFSENVDISTKDTANTAVIAYLIQKISGKSYQTCLNEFFNKYAELNYLSGNNDNDINRLLNQSHLIYGVNNISMDPQSFAVIQGLLKQFSEKDKLNFFEIKRHCFTTQLMHNVLLNKELNTVNISFETKDGVTFVIQTENTQSKKYYLKMAKKLIKFSDKYLS